MMRRWNGRASLISQTGARFPVLAAIEVGTDPAGSWRGSLKFLRVPEPPHQGRWVLEFPTGVSSEVLMDITPVLGRGRRRYQGTFVGRSPASDAQFGPAPAHLP